MKCPYCGAEVYYTKCDFCDSIIDESFSEANNELFQEVTRNLTLNDFRKDTINQKEEISCKKKSVAFILCCLGFFGPSGVHRLYAGRYLTGLLWLCTGGLFGIGTIIDLVSILMNNFNDSNQKTISEW